MAAAYPDSKESLTLLLKFGAHVHARNEKGITAIFHCATRGNLESVKLLVEHGANVNDRMNGPGIGGHRTAVGQAAVNGHFHVLKYLVAQHGADINVPGDTMVGRPLNIALARNRPDIAQYLINS